MRFCRALHKDKDNTHRKANRADTEPHLLSSMAGSKAGSKAGNREGHRLSKEDMAAELLRLGQQARGRSRHTSN